jgi:hypothetical protein
VFEAKGGDIWDLCDSQYIDCFLIAFVLLVLVTKGCCVFQQVGAEFQSIMLIMQQFIIWAVNLSSEYLLAKN